LREALDRLRGRLSQIYEKGSGGLLKDPWLAREDYIRVILDRSHENIESFMDAHLIGEKEQWRIVRALKLLEMQRHAMLMYTSCGWFFDDISGIETVQILQYAARAIQLSEELDGAGLEGDFLSILKKAPGNTEDYKTGEEVYKQIVRPSVLDHKRVAIHYAVSLLFKQYENEGRVYSYGAQKEFYDYAESGKKKLTSGTLTITSEVTKESSRVNFIVLHFGDHNIIGKARYSGDGSGFREEAKNVKEAFLGGDIPRVMKLMDEYFPEESYSLWHLFKNEQKKVLVQLFGEVSRETEKIFREIFTKHSSMIQAADRIKLPLPAPLLSVAEYIMDMDMRRILTQGEVDIGKLKEMAFEVNRLSLNVDKAKLGLTVSEKAASLLEEFRKSADKKELLSSICGILETAGMLGLGTNLWKAQNLYFAVGRENFKNISEKAKAGDKNAEDWISEFRCLGEHLGVKID
jgi:hypothetical protein